MTYIAHTKENSEEIQTLRDHLWNSKMYAEKYGDILGIPHVTGVAALVHDLGKYRQEFQKYIRHSEKAKKGSVDHSSFGAVFLKEKVKELSQQPEGFSADSLFAEIISNAVFSHHNSLGLKDYLNARLKSPYYERVEKFDIDPEKKIELKQAESLFYQETMAENDFNIYLKTAMREFSQLFKELLKDQDGLLDNLYYVGQFIYSCLLDADRTDTSLFSFGKSATEYQYDEIFEQYYGKLLNSISKFDQSTKINQARSEMSDECDAFADQADGIYRLSIPTGGGKTLASQRYG